MGILLADLARYEPLSFLVEVRLRLCVAGPTTGGAHERFLLCLMERELITTDMSLRDGVSLVGLGDSIMTSNGCAA